MQNHGHLLFLFGIKGEVALMKVLMVCSACPVVWSQRLCGGGNAADVTLPEISSPGAVSCFAFGGTGGAGVGALQD